MNIFEGVFWIYIVYDIFRDFLQMYYESKARNWDVEAMGTGLNFPALAS